MGLLESIHETIEQLRSRANQQDARIGALEKEVAELETKLTQSTAKPQGYSIRQLAQMNSISVSQMKRYITKRINSGELKAGRDYVQLGPLTRRFPADVFRVKEQGKVVDINKKVRKTG